MSFQAKHFQKEMAKLLFLFIYYRNGNDFYNIIGMKKKWDTSLEKKKNELCQVMFEIM